jgi:hypothetical protein
VGSGRKERWTSEDYAKVIQLISEGRPLTDCLGGKDKPGKTAFYQRLKEDSQLARDYELALTLRASCRIDALLDVNERLLKGEIDPSSAKVISQNLQWLAGKEDRALGRSLAYRAYRSRRQRLARSKRGNLEL